MICARTAGAALTGNVFRICELDRYLGAELSLILHSNFLLVHEGNRCPKHPFFPPFVSPRRKNSDKFLVSFRLQGARRRAVRVYRSSEITLPSFGSEEVATSSTLPPSFVTARSVADSSF